jgi:hypothetical protein
MYVFESRQAVDRYLASEIDAAMGANPHRINLFSRISDTHESRRACPAISWTAFHTNKQHKPVTGGQKQRVACPPPASALAVDRRA